MVKIVYLGRKHIALPLGKWPLWWYFIQTRIVPKCLHPQQLELTCVPLTRLYRGVQLDVWANYVVRRFPRSLKGASCSTLLYLLWWAHYHNEMLTFQLNLILMFKFNHSPRQQGINQCVSHFRSKLSYSGLNGSRVIAETSWWLTDTQETTDAGNDNTPRSKQTSGKKCLKGSGWWKDITSWFVLRKGDKLLTEPIST